MHDDGFLSSFYWFAIYQRGKLSEPAKNIFYAYVYANAYIKCEPALALGYFCLDSIQTLLEVWFWIIIRIFCYASSPSRLSH